MANKEYDNTNRGALFKNDKREKESHPEYKGSINVGGNEYWLSAWVKEGKRGKFFSLSVKAKDDVQREAVAKLKEIVEEPFHDDDIPF